MCTYHGWTYDLKGKLVGVPGFKDYYHEDLNREEWGLVTAAKVDSYKGFIFATLDPEAPDLDEYLGEVGRMGIDMHRRARRHRRSSAASRSTPSAATGSSPSTTSGTATTPDHPRLVDHGRLARRPIGRRCRDMRARLDQPHMTLLGEYGHAIGGPATTQQNDAQTPGVATRPGASGRRRRRALGPGRHRSRAATPTSSPTSGSPPVSQVCLRMPKGPTTTEIWWFTLVDKATAGEAATTSVQPRDPHLRPGRHARAGRRRELGPEHARHDRARSRGAIPLNYAMNLGRGEIIEDELGPPRIEIDQRQRAPPALALPRLGRVDGGGQLGAT